MKQKLLFLALCSIFLCGHVYADPIDVLVGIIDDKPLSSIPTKGPLLVPNLDITNRELTFQDGNSRDYTLVLLDEDGVVVWQTVVPAATSTVVIPATLTGDFELRLYPDGTAYYFYGNIILFSN